MENGASKDAEDTEMRYTEMTIKREVEEPSGSGAYVEIEVNMNCIKEEPGLVELEESDPGLSVKEEVLENTWQAVPDTEFISKTTQSEQQAQSQLNTCDKCAKIFSSKASLRQHSRHAHLTESHKCTECNKEFSRKYYLCRHTSNVHSRQQYECAVCKKICKSKEALNTHVLRYHRPGSETCVYICDYCQKTFTLKPSLQNHITCVHAIGSYKCNQCNKRFKCERYLMSHAANVHTSGQVCNVCGKSVRPSHLKQHIRTMHGDKQRQSKLFEETAKPNQYLRQHLNDLHGQQSAEHLQSNEASQAEQEPVNQLYRCDPCRKSYKYKFNLTRHHKRVHGDESHKCSECNKEFKSKDYLVAHVRYTHRKQQNCKEKYESKQELTRHVARLHELMSAGPHANLYTCDYCLKAFRRKRSVRQHIERVHGPRVHQCRMCDKMFKCKEHLQQHNKYIHGNAQQEGEASRVCKDVASPTVHFKCAHGSEECQLKNKCSICIKALQYGHNLEKREECGKRSCLAADKMCAAEAGTSAQLHNVVVVKVEPADEELKQDSVVFQHMDCNYQLFKEEPQSE